MVLGIYKKYWTSFNSCYIMYIGYNICMKNVETHPYYHLVLSMLL